MKKFISLFIGVMMIFSCMPNALANGTTVYNTKNSEEFADAVAATQYFAKFEIEAASAKDCTDNTFALKRLVVRSDFKVPYMGADYAIEFEDITILGFNTEEETKTAYEELSKTDRIISVEADFIISIAESEISTPTSEPTASPTATPVVDSWGYGEEYINMDAFKDEYLKDRDDLAEIVVAVIDSGIDSDHPAFEGRITDGKNFLNSNSYPEDDNSHGTHVSGIICNGTEANVKIMPLKVLDARGTGSATAMLAAVRYAVDNGADIINMSLGGTNLYSASSSYTAAVEYAYKAGCPLICAAGNNAYNSCNSFPANIRKTISVAATNAKNVRATGFSNYGDLIDLSAPGLSISSCVPGGRYETKSGTSMACPHISACAANIMSVKKGLSVSDIETLLKYNAKPVSDSDNYRMGDGIVDMGDFSFKGVSVDKRYQDVAVGAEFKLKASTYPKTNIEWSVTDDGILSVDENGNITAKSAGVAKVIAYANGVADECEVTVRDIGEWYSEDADIYYISSPDELRDIAELVNSSVTDFKDKTIVLENDIDVEYNEWQPIGKVTYDYSEEHIFNGTFNGMRHAVSGIKANIFEMYQGLFGIIGEYGTVKNLNISGVNNLGEYACGGIAGLNKGKIIYCIVSGQIKSKNGCTTCAGGMAAVNKGEIINCRNFATILNQTSVQMVSGGIAGRNKGNIINSFSGAVVQSAGSTKTGLSHSGGITGLNEGLLENTVSTSKVRATIASGVTGVEGAVCGYNAADIKNSYWLYDEESGLTANGISNNASGNLENTMAFDMEKTLTETVDTGGYIGTKLLSALNFYAEAYNADEPDEMMKFWQKDDKYPLNLYITPYVLDTEVSKQSARVKVFGYDKDGIIRTALYDDNGVCLENREVENGEVISFDKTGSYVKTFWWTDEMVPKCLCEMVQ